MFILFGTLTLISAALFFYWYLSIKDYEETYIDVANQYPIYHWKFLSKRYKVSYIKWTSFILLLLGLSMIIVQFI